MGRGGLVSRVTKRLSVERSWVRIPPARFRILSKFVYPTLLKSLGMLLVYPKRMAVGVKPKEERAILT